MIASGDKMSARCNTASVGGRFADEGIHGENAGDNSIRCYRSASAKTRQCGTSLSVKRRARGCAGMHSPRPSPEQDYACACRTNDDKDVAYTGRTRSRGAKSFSQGREALGIGDRRIGKAPQGRHYCRRLCCVDRCRPAGALIPITLAVQGLTAPGYTPRSLRDQETRQRIRSKCMHMHNPGQAKGVLSMCSPRPSPEALGVPPNAIGNHVMAR